MTEIARTLKSSPAMETTLLAATAGDAIWMGGATIAFGDCGTVSATIRDALTDSANTGLAKTASLPSRRFIGVWYIAARVNGDGVAIWTTGSDPSSNDPGLTMVANDSARQISSLGVDVPDSAPIDVAKARFETDELADAEACV